MRENNFDLLRLGLASIVMLFHASILSQAPELAWIRHFFSATFAVQAFFTVSGFLIFMSYERSRTIRSYAEKRLLRILPAYVCALFFAILLGSVCTTLSVSEYWLAPGTWKYLGFNLAFMNYAAPDLPGVFLRQYASAVNGSLWTLKIELMFYAFVPIFFWACKRIPMRYALTALYFASVVYCAVLTRLSEASGSELYSKLAKQFPGQLSYFVAGAAAYYWHSAGRKVSVVAALAACMLYLAIDGMILRLIGPALVAIIAAYIAVWAPRLGNFGRYGDFSYGIYIYHFPIIQATVSSGLFFLHPWLGLLCVIGVVLVAAWLSWHLVESPAIRSGSVHPAVAS